MSVIVKIARCSKILDKGIRKFEFQCHSERFSFICYSLRLFFIVNSERISNSSGSCGVAMIVICFLLTLFPPKEFIRSIHSYTVSRRKFFLVCTFKKSFSVLFISFLMRRKKTPTIDKNSAKIRIFLFFFFFIYLCLLLGYRGNINGINTINTSTPGIVSPLQFIVTYKYTLTSYNTYLCNFPPIKVTDL